jgi:hypothetical protein
VTVVRKSMASVLPAFWAVAYDIGARTSAAAPARREANLMLKFLE